MSWRIRLSSRAEAGFRALPRDQQRLLADRIDALGGTGLPGGGPEVSGGDAIIELRAGDHVLLAVERPEQTIDILTVEPLAERPWRTLMRALTAARVWPIRGPATCLPSAGRRAHGRDPWRPRRPGPGALVADLLTDLRFALRSFGRSPAPVALVVLTLAVGIGGNTAIFGVVHNVFLSPLPFEDGDQVVRLRDFALAPNGEQRRFNMSPLNFVAIRERNDVFEEVVAQNGRSFTLTGPEAPERLSGIMVSPNWASMLGLQPALGRSFTEEQERLGFDSGVVLVSHGLWQGRLGGDPDIVGKSILLDGRSHIVVGVMPPDFHFPYDAEVWFPASFDRHDGRSHDLNVLARLKPGVTLEAAEAEVDAVAAALEREYPRTNTNVGLVVEPAREDFIEDQDQIVLALLGAVGFLLLIACVNVTSILVVRFTGRAHEIGVRAALGAGRIRQLRQFLAETVLLFVMGGAGGVLLTWLLADYLTVLIPNVLRDQLALGEIRVTSGVLVFAGVISVVMGLVFGLVAALRGSKPDLQSLLKESGRSLGSRHRVRVQRVLVMSELSLALVLLAGAGLMIRHFQRLVGDDLGFEAEGLLTMRVNLEAARYGNGDRRPGLLREMKGSLERLPGVSATGITTVNPLCCGDWGAGIEVEGRQTPADVSTLVHHRYVTPGLFEAMQISLLRGRTFTDSDDRSAARVVIIDASMAAHFWPDEDPLGKRVRLARREEDVPWNTVVGVVGDVRDAGDYADTWYLPYYQEPAGRSTDQLHIMVRASAGVSAVTRAAQQAIWDVDPTLAIYGVSEMKGLYRDSLSQDRLGAIVVTLFAAFGLALAAFGVYGLMSFVVSQQRREISMRIALGAARRDVLAMVLGQATRLVALGSVMGVAAAFALSRVLAHLVSGIEAVDPGMLVVVMALLGGVTLLATYVPARRAAGLDPMQVLRT